MAFQNVVIHIKASKYYLEKDIELNTYAIKFTDC